ERHFDHTAAEALDGRDLRLRRVVGRDHGARDAELPRGPGDALRHVARTRGDEPGGDVLRPARRVVGAADLERADRLEVLELEVDLSGRLQPDEWCADGRPRERLAGGLDLLE